MDTELLKSGCLLMVLGMGTVYFFIILMMYCMNFTTKMLNIINRYFPEKTNENKKVPLKKDDTEIAIAIACAVKQGGNKC